MAFCSAVSVAWATARCTCGSFSSPSLRASITSALRSTSWSSSIG
ncbi:MAG: hypothetical protein WDN49_20490 [Acetobacteraceae bacterium]